jgi:hypothetical protein
MLHVQPRDGTSLFIHTSRFSILVAKDAPTYIPNNGNMNTLTPPTELHIKERARKWYAKKESSITILYTFSASNHNCYQRLNLGICFFFLNSLPRDFFCFSQRLAMLLNHITQRMSSGDNSQGTIAAKIVHSTRIQSPPLHD